MTARAVEGPCSATLAFGNEKLVLRVVANMEKHPLFADKHRSVTLYKGKMVHPGMVQKQK